MTQDFTQEFSKGSFGYSTGATVPATGLYKSSDGKMQFIELMEKDSTFPPYPGGNGKNKALWYRVTKTTDGNKTSFTAVVGAETM